MQNEKRRIVLAQAGMGDPLCRRLTDKLDGLGELTICVSLTHTLSLLEQTSAELLLLDLDLPDAAGHGSIARVRRSFPRLPVVTIASEASPQAIETSRRAGAADCWTLAEAAAWTATMLLDRLTSAVWNLAPLDAWDMKPDCRLLLADPLESRRGPIAAMLERAGARVARAADGMGALSKALAAEERGDPFAAILLCDPLPGLDDSAAEVLREAGYRRPIIGLQASTESDTKRDAFDEWLSAPIDRAALIEALRKWTR